VNSIVAGRAPASLCRVPEFFFSLAEAVGRRVAAVWLVLGSLAAGIESWLSLACGGVPMWPSVKIALQLTGFAF
ncbi:MAG: hypothetical protein WBD65_07870, partial [Methylocella sp.]